MEFVNEHGNHPILSQYDFVPFGRGAAIDPPTFCSLIHMQNKLLHTIKHFEIPGLADIDIDRHLGNDMDDGEDISNSIRDIFLEASDESGQHLFHSIERTIKLDFTRAISTKQNQNACNEILNDIDTWRSSKLSDSQAPIAFRAHSSVKIFTSTIDQRKSQHQVKFNAYAQRIAKRICYVNPNEPDEYWDTAPLMIPKRHINVSYAAAVASPSPTPDTSENKHVVSPPNIDMLDMPLHIPTPTGGNSIRLAELESSLLSIQSKHTSMQSDHTQLKNEFQKVLTGVLKHSKEIQAIQSEVRGLTTMMQEIRNIIFPMQHICLDDTPLQPLELKTTFHLINQPQW
jgi:hypothetical protein